MGYQALARKWRPHDFDSLVGQEHVVRMLKNALNSGRFHHALIFTGTRGVGKTTIARVIAKCLNCSRGMSATPCGECSACKSIDGGNFIDLIEVDAASHSKVEETRELMDSVSYKPVQGQYKVYLIDEVHMFSEKSMNALLKTLEEPPPHVKFLLATTDPQKLPITVLSRCLQFNLRRLSSTLICKHLGQISEREGVAAEAAALALIATAADGSMRDALGLLDEAIAYGGDTVSAADTATLLGTVERSRVMALIEAIVAGSGVKTFEIAAAMADDMVDFADVLASMMACLQRIAVLQIVPERVPTPPHSDPALAEIAHRALPEDIQIYYQIALQGRRDIADAPDPQVAFDITLVRLLAFVPAASASTHLASVVAAPVPAPMAPRASTDTAPAPAPMAPRASTDTPFRSAAAIEDEGWEALVARMDLRGPAAQLAQHCVIEHKTDTSVRLRLPTSHAFLNTDRARKLLSDSLCELRGGAQRVIINYDEECPASASSITATVHQSEQSEQRPLQAADAPISNKGDPGVRLLIKTFDARILSSKETGGPDKSDS